MFIIEINSTHYSSFYNGVQQSHQERIENIPNLFHLTDNIHNITNEISLHSVISQNTSATAPTRRGSYVTMGQSAAAMMKYVLCILMKSFHFVK